MTAVGPRARGRTIAAIVIVAIVLRFVFSAWVVGLGAMTRGDEEDYHAIAAHLVGDGTFAGGDGHVTGRRPPGYPFFLAGIYALAGPDPVAGRVAQVLLGGFVVLLTALVARRVFDGATALAAAALAAVSPFLIFASGYLLTENLYMVFLLGALWVVPRVRDLEAASTARAVAVAALLGLATLTRPTGLPVLEWTIAALLVLGASGWRRRLVRAALVVAVFAVILAPWVVRNARVMGGWMLTTHGGITFYQGNNPAVASVAGWRGGAAPLGALPHFDTLSTLSEVDRDRMAWQLGRDYLRENPGEIPALVGWKLVRFWRLKSDMGLSGIRSGWWWSKDTGPGRLAATTDVGMLYALAVLPLFAIGLWITRRRWRDLVLPYGIVVTHTAVAVVFFGSLRGRLPVEPVICIFAGASLAGIARALRARRAWS